VGTRPAQTLAQRIGHFLERQGLLGRDAENSYRAGEAVEALPAEDPLPRRHHARYLRAARLHRPAGGFGAQAEGQPDPFPWGICAQQPVPVAGDEGQAGQGRPACLDRRSGGADSGRTLGLDDLGAAPETGVQHRHRDLPGLWWGSADHRLH